MLAAYHLMMGMTQKDAGCAIGRSLRTIGNWIADTYWWQQARQEAEDRWLYDLKDVARQAVYSQVKAGDGNLGLTILERTDERLRKEPQRVAFTDADGNDLPPIRDRFAAKLAAMAARQAASAESTNGHSTPLARDHLGDTPTN